jgi:hypothetical protein
MSCLYANYELLQGTLLTQLNNRQKKYKDRVPNASSDGLMETVRYSGAENQCLTTHSSFS